MPGTSWTLCVLSLLLALALAGAALAQEPSPSNGPARLIKTTSDEPAFSASPWDAFTFGNTIFFSADDGVHGRDPRRHEQ